MAKLLEVGGIPAGRAAELAASLIAACESTNILSRAEKTSKVGSTGQRNMIAVTMRWEYPQWHAPDDRDYRLS